MNNARLPKSPPENTYTPKIVEYQCGSKDINQSKAAKEVVKANVLAAEKGDSIYNVALGNYITINELAKKIIKLTDSGSKINHLEERPGDIKHSYADVSKLRSLGFEPSFDFDEAMSKTIDYFKTIYQ